MPDEELKENGFNPHIGEKEPVIRYDILLNESAEIMRYAKEFGSFSLDQTFLMQGDLPEVRIKICLTMLVETKRIHQLKDGTYRHYTYTENVKYDPVMVDALWVMLTHKGPERKTDTDPGFWFLRAERPALIWYFMKGSFYEIVPLYKGNTAILRMYEERFKAEERDRRAGLYVSPHKWIFLIEDEDDISLFPFVRLPHRFAKVNSADNKSHVTFYRGNEIFDE